VTSKSIASKAKSDIPVQQRAPSASAVPQQEMDRTMRGRAAGVARRSAVAADPRDIAIALADLSGLFEALMRHAFTGSIHIAIIDAVPDACARMNEIVGIRLRAGSPPIEAEIRTDLAWLNRFFGVRYARGVRGDMEMKFEGGRLRGHRCQRFYPKVQPVTVK